MAAAAFPGLLSADKKRAFTLQLGGQDQGVADDPSVTGLNLPSNVFANSPKGAIGTGDVSQAPAPQIKEFSFNPKYAQQDQTMRRKLADAGYQRTTAQADVNDTYNRTVDEASRQKSDALQRLLEQMSSRGLVQSGINIQEQGKTTDAYQRYLDNLSNDRAKALSGIEGSYAGTVNDIASAREAMYLQQVQEEEAARLEDERRAAEAAQKQAEADRQAQMMQDLIAAQQAAITSYQAPQIAMPSSPGIGVSIPSLGGGGGSAPEAPAPSNYQNLQGLNISQVMKSTNVQALQSWATNPNIPAVIKIAAESRLRQLNPSPQAKAAGSSVASSAANLAKGLFKR